MEHLKTLHWPLILSLAAVALIRPLKSIVGLMDDIGRPLTPPVVTLVISLI